jgi:hypothetical protein
LLVQFFDDAHLPVGFDENLAATLDFGFDLRSLER